MFWNVNIYVCKWRPCVITVLIQMKGWPYARIKKQQFFQCEKKIIKLLALWMVICSWITVLHVLTLLYSLYILYVPSPLTAAWPTNFHFCWYCNAPECSTRPGCCVFQRLSRGSPGIVCEEESYRRICTRLELPTVTFLFCHRIFFFLFLWLRWEVCNKQHVCATLTLFTPSFLYRKTQQRGLLSALKGEPLQHVSFNDSSGDYSALGRST